MSTTPSSISPNPDSQSSQNAEWRASVTQNYRSMEVREIAKVLASLEPGASQESKLMLAMRFEETIFSAATSLADYRKKLAKRLKKLKKMYVPGAAGAAANRPGAAGKAASDAEQRVVELRRKYGDALLFIYQRAAKAVAEMAKKSGKERAQHLAKHTDNAKSWANQLGLLQPGSASTTGASSKPASLPKLEVAEIDRLENHLQTRVENIRSHVVKLTEPDLFLQERLEELEEQYMTPATSKLLSRCFTKRFSQLRWSEFADAPKALQQSLEKALQIVPPPSRDPRSQKQAALAHLDAMRAASQAVLSYLASDNKSTTTIESASSSSAAPILSRHILLKCHTRAVQGIEFLQEELPGNQNQDSTGKRKLVTLEDAWTKVMETPTSDDDTDVALPDATTQPASIDDSTAVPLSKRLKPTVVKSRVLLTPGRACPSSLKPALKRKGATLYQQAGAVHISLDFEDAFTMTIYLVPLVVILKSKSDGTKKSDGTETSNKVSVWGADGTWESLGHVVKERLDYASAHATQILRGCFAACQAKADFEWEIAEATALLQFLKLARTTYIPDWQDADL